MVNRSFWGLMLILIITISACANSNSNRTVVIYTSVDQPYAEPILKAFQAKTGIRVLPVFDVEAAKTTGLVNRLIAEKHVPRADVFWNGEFAQTLLLKDKGVLAPYDSPMAQNIPNQYRDSEYYWTGFGARARVLIVNSDLVSLSEYPKSIFDLLSPQWPGGKIGIAYPLFGTTATHAAALYAAMGSKQARAYFEKLNFRQIRVVDGNSVVRNMVSGGQLLMGLTDTDDACGAKRKGAPIELVFMDQEHDGLGTLLIPNTVALIANASHPLEAKILIDFLLSEEVEQELVKSGWSQIPLRSIVAQTDCLSGISIKGMNLSLRDVYEQIQFAKKELTEIFIR